VVTGIDLIYSHLCNVDPHRIGVRTTGGLWF